MFIVSANVSWKDTDGYAHIRQIPTFYIRDCSWDDVEKRAIEIINPMGLTNLRIDLYSMKVL